MSFIFLIRMSNFMSIECYLSFDHSTYFFSIILNYKNLNLKYLIDNIALNFFIFKKFCKHGKYKKNIRSNGRFINIHI